MNNRIWVIAAAILSIAVVALGLVVGILPKFAESAKDELTRLGVNAQNEAYAADLARLKDEFEDLDKVVAELTKLQESLPADHQEQEFLRQVDAAALSAGVNVTEYTQDAPVVYGSFDQAGEATEGQTPIQGGSLLGIPVSVTAVAFDIHSLYAFIKPLQQGQRLYMLSSIAVTSEPIGDEGAVVYKMVVTGYIYTLAGAGDAAPTAEATPTPEPTETEAPEPTDTPAPTDTATPSP